MRKRARGIKCTGLLYLYKYSRIEMYVCDDDWIKSGVCQIYNFFSLCYSYIVSLCITLGKKNHFFFVITMTVTIFS